MKAPRLLISVALTLLLAGTMATSFAQQSGYYILDGFGGVHAGGGAPKVLPPTPYFGFDVAEDIVYVPPGTQGRDGVLVLDAFGGVHRGGAIAVDSLAPATPYFGFDVARGIALRGGGFAVRAHGQVFHDATVSQGRNMSTSNVTRPETGVYCISGLPFTPINAVVSNSAVFNAGEKDVRVYAIGVVGGDVCGVGNQIRIHVYSPGALTLSNGNFNIVIF
jgi:hypothetical protein